MLPFTMAKNTGFSRWLCICVYYHYPPCVVLECRVCWCGSVGIMKNINISSGPGPGPGQPAEQTLADQPWRKYPNWKSFTSYRQMGTSAKTYEKHQLLNYFYRGEETIYKQVSFCIYFRNVNKINIFKGLDSWNITSMCYSAYLINIFMPFSRRRNFHVIKWAFEV